MHLLVGRPQIALDWLSKDTHKPISSLYWQYRVVNAYPNMGRQPDEADELLKKAADAGHVLARRDMGLRMLTGKGRFETRFRGLRIWLGTFRYALRLITNDPSDERLR
jgi:TPR repeat protein